MNVQGIRYTPAQRTAMRDQAAKLYAAGATIEETAAELGCSNGYARNLLIESGVQMRRRSAIKLPEGMLTSGETAAMVGLGRAAFMTMCHRGDGPPRATQQPFGAPRNYTYYWRRDVEQWMRERDERQRQQDQDREAEAARQAQELRDSAAALDLVPDWDALLQAVDAKRLERGFSWHAVCQATGIDQGHLSRVRSGYRPGLSGIFLRLAMWARGEVPAELVPFLRAA